MSFFGLSSGVLQSKSAAGRMPLLQAKNSEKKENQGDSKSLHHRNLATLNKFSQPLLSFIVIFNRLITLVFTELD